MAPPSFAKIDKTRIAAVSFTYRPSETILGFRNRHQMHMVGHQTVSPDLDGTAGTPLSYQIQIGPIIIVAEKGLLAAVAPLRHMMGPSGGHDSCYSRHNWIVALLSFAVKKKVWCPRNS
jgi:hypothetical protein